MDPISLATIGIVSSVAGAGVGAVGAATSASANANMYQYQAGIAQQNEVIDKQNATYALMSGESQAAQTGLAGRYRMGEILTGQAASGFSVSGSSSTNVRAGQQSIINTEETTIRSNSAKAAYDYSIGAFQQGEQANIYSSAASNAQTAGALGVASSLIGGAGQVSTKWLSATQQGINVNNVFGF